MARSTTSRANRHSLCAAVVDQWPNRFVMEPTVASDSRERSRRWRRPIIP